MKYTYVNDNRIIFIHFEYKYIQKKFFFFFLPKTSANLKSFSEKKNFSQISYASIYVSIKKKKKNRYPLNSDGTTL